MTTDPAEKLELKRFYTGVYSLEYISRKVREEAKEKNISEADLDMFIRFMKHSRTLYCYVEECRNAIDAQLAA